MGKTIQSVPFRLFLLALAGLGVVVFRNAPLSIRFESDLLNYAFVILALLLLPVSLLWGTYRAFSGAARWVSLTALGIACTVVLFFPILFVAIDFVDIAKTGRDNSLEKISEQVINGHCYRLYRTNGGATTSYGLILRGESEPFLGFKIVRTIKNFYPASNAKLEVLPSGIARLIIDPYSAGDSAEYFEFQP